MPSWPLDTSVVPDDYIAALSFVDAQAIFSARGSVVRTGVMTTCGWHGTKFDPRLGSFAVVRAGGPLEAMLGERVKVTAREGGAFVYAWVCDAKDSDEPITVTRRLFIELAPPATDVLNVLVEVAP